MQNNKHLMFIICWWKIHDFLNIPFNHKLSLGLTSKETIQNCQEMLFFFVKNTPFFEHFLQFLIVFRINNRWNNFKLLGMIFFFMKNTRFFEHFWQTKIDFRTNNQENNLKLLEMIFFSWKTHYFLNISYNS